MEAIEIAERLARIEEQLKFISETLSETVEIAKANNDTISRLNGNRIGRLERRVHWVTIGFIILFLLLLALPRDGSLINLLIRILGTMPP